MSLTLDARRSFLQEPTAPAPKARGRIGVFAGAKEFSALSSALSQLSYRVIRGAKPDRTRRPQPDDHLSVAIISDATDRPLDLCAALSRKCPTILIASDATFE